jgi:hypothetical protein
MINLNEHSEYIFDEGVVLFILAEGNLSVNLKIGFDNN